MDILLCLLERQGDVVSPDELLAGVWRGINVEPAALRVQINVLPRLLPRPTQTPATYPRSPAARIASSPLWRHIEARAVLRECGLDPPT
jgi:hypothetical protein